MNFILAKMVSLPRSWKNVGLLIILGFCVYTVFISTERSSVSKYYVKNLKEILECSDTIPTASYFGQRGKYWVHYNYFRATKHFQCDESITYTTHSDWTFLDNLIPILERWQGPLSLALYSPGTDFGDSIKRIQYLRECVNSSLVKELVTFHLFYDQNHLPKTGVIREPSNLPVNCSELEKTNITFGEKLETYKKADKTLTYPVNIARNIAKETATTHFVFPSDIELYPNPGLIPAFLEMIRRNDTILQSPQPKVFVLPIFEIEANVRRLPENKKELISMLKNNSAIPFHKYVCSYCHRVPQFEEWINENVTETGLHVFHVGKRYKPYQHWEPIFIGTRYDPVYDERLSWEGRQDKMTQVIMKQIKYFRIQMHKYNIFCLF